MSVMSLFFTFFFDHNISPNCIWLRLVNKQKTFPVLQQTFFFVVLYRMDLVLFTLFL